MFSISIQKYGPLLRTTDERSSADFHSGRTSDGNRCKVDIEIAAMDGGDEPQAVRSTDHWHAIASGLVCASSALTGGPWGVSQSADFFFAEMALPSVVRRSASVCFTDTPR